MRGAPRADDPHGRAPVCDNDDVVNPFDFSKYRITNLPGHATGGNFDALTLPKCLNLREIKAMLDFVARALCRVELKVYSVVSPNPVI
jgi:hypothetical protein